MTELSSGGGAGGGAPPFEVGDRVVIKGDRGPVMIVDKCDRYTSGSVKGQYWVQADGETWRADLLVAAPMSSDPPISVPNPFKGTAHRGPAVDNGGS